MRKIKIFTLCLGSVFAATSVFASCPLISTSFTPSAVDICGLGATTISFVNTSTGSNASTASYIWFLNGTQFDSTYALSAPVTSSISAVGTYTYMVVANDSSGTCTESFSVNVTIHPLPVPSYTFTPDNACAGTTVSFTNTSTGSDGSTAYSWDFGDASTSTLSNSTHSYATGGVYPVVLTMTNTVGCTATFNLNVTVKAVPIVNISGDDGSGTLFHCLLPTDTTSQETVTFFNTTTGATSYTWDYGDGSPIFNTTSTASHTHVYTSYGTYTVTYTATSSGGCSVTQTLTVVFEKFVAASFSVPVTETSGCLPHVVNPVNGSVNANTYIWDFGDGSPLVTTTSYIPPPHSYLTIGMYTISVTAANSCNTSNATVGPIIISGPPTVTFSNSLGINNGCAPQVVTFTNSSTGAVPANNYTWDMGNGNVYTNTTSPPSQTYNLGQYTVSLVGFNACGSDSIATTFTVDTVPQVTMNVNPIEGCTPFTVNAFDSTYGGALTTQWYIDGGVWGYTGWPCWCWQYLPNYTNIDTIPTQVFTAPPGNAIATHTIRLVVSNHCGIFDSTVNVIVHPDVQSIFTPLNSTTCVGSSVTFTQSSYGDSLTFAWDFGNGSTATTVGPHTITYTTAGTYTIQLITTGHCGVDTLISSLTVVPYPIAAILLDTLNGCEDLTVNFTNNSSPGATSYAWNFGGGAIPTTSAVFNPGAVLFPNSGINMATLAVDSLGCVSRDTAYIDVYALPLPSFTVTPNVGCSPLDVVINNTSPVVVGDIYSWNLGNGNTSTLQNPLNQTYTTTIIDSIYNIKLTIQTVNGCIDSVAQTVTVHPIPIASILPSSDTVCVNENIIFSNNSIGATTYAWNFGDGNISVAINPTHAYIAAGTYVVQLISTSAFACSDTMITTILVDSLPTSNFSYTIECVGNPTIFTDSSSNAISWSWNFGNGNTSILQNPSNLYALAGTYNVSLTTTNIAGCTHTLTMPVVVKSVAVAAFTNSSTCLGAITSFTDASSGTPISWTWDFGDGNTSIQQNPSNLYVSIGNYPVQLIVTAGSGCFDTIAQAITVDSVPTANFTFTNVCANDSTFFTSISTGNPDTYNWNFGNGNTDNTNNTNPSNIYLIDGSYTVALIVGYVASGCTDTSTQVVTAYPRTAPSFNNNTACLNDTTFFTDLTTNSPTTWNWNFGDGNTSAIQNVNHTYLLDGTYNVTLVTSNSFGCTDSVSQTITVNPLPTALFSFDTVCLNVPTTFIDNSVNTATWTWDFGDGFTSASQNSTHIYAAAGTYAVQLIAANSFGCTDTVVNNIIVNPNPFAIFIADTMCFGVPTTFTDNSTGFPVSWGWNFGDGNIASIQNPTDIYPIDSTYIAQLIIANIFGCEDTVTNNVVILPMPIAAFSVALSCAKQPSVFADSSLGSPNMWQWDFGDGNTSTVQNPSNIYLLGGSYNVQLIAGNGAGCSDTIITPVTVSTVPTPDFIADTVCFGSITTFTNTSIDSVGFAAYYWDFGDNINTSSIANPTYTYQTSGTYTVTLTVTNVNGCDSAISYPVVVNSIPVANYTADTVCLGFSTTFTDISSGTPNVWNWDFGDGINSTIGPIATHIYLTSGSFLTSLYVASGIAGCSDQLFNTVVVIDNVVAEISVNTPVCEGEVFNFTDNSILNSGSIIAWNWNFGDGNTSVQQNPNYTYNSAGSYTVTLNVLSNGSCYDSSIVNVVVNPLPTVNTGNDTTIYINSTAPLTVTGGGGYLWIPSQNLTCSQCSNPIASPTETTTYYITVTDSNNCISTDSLIISIDISCGDVFVPNIFSPNGDGENDILYVYGNCISSMDFFIYDRWGNKIFQSSDKMIGWDGKYKGNEMNISVFAYYLKTKLLNGETVERKGTITIVK